jgi:tRNA pseudouridine38-40 synthase
LARLNGGRRVKVSSAGRTDAGVHATGQVIAFTWTTGMPGTELGRALGALLPRDVSIGHLVRVAAAFDPRRAAVRRTYRYSIWTGPRSPLRDRYALGLEERLDVEAMQDAAGRLVGRQDFSAFGRARQGAIRTIFEVRVRRQGNLVTIDVTGDAFLRQMVRSIVAALIRIGMGRATADDLTDELRSPGRAFAGAVVPPRGLCLRHVAIATQRNDRKKEVRQGP